MEEEVDVKVYNGIVVDVQEGSGIGTWSAPSLPSSLLFANEDSVHSPSFAMWYL
jgi:hypothetical protein